MIKTFIASIMMALIGTSAMATETPKPTTKPVQTVDNQLVGKPAIERYIVKNDMGGVVTQFKESLIYIEKNKMPVSVEEKCFSACTLILSTKYNIDKCVKPNVVFMFHQPYASLQFGSAFIPSNTIVDIVGTERMWKSDFYDPYPDWVKKAIDLNGGVPSAMRGDHPDKSFNMTYADVKAYVPTCN